MLSLTVALAIAGATNSHAADFAASGKSAVLHDLKDARSAMFRNTFVNGSSFCGEVNARNSYGGYVGYQRFIAVAGASAINVADSMWREYCWPKKKFQAYQEKQKDADKAIEIAANKKKMDADAAYYEDIERQRAEIRKQAEEQKVFEERDRERAQADEK